MADYWIHETTNHRTGHVHTTLISSQPQNSQSAKKIHSGEWLIEWPSIEFTKPQTTNLDMMHTTLKISSQLTKLPKGWEWIFTWENDWLNGLSIDWIHKLTRTWWTKFFCLPLVYYTTRRDKLPYFTVKFAQRMNEESALGATPAFVVSDLITNLDICTQP